MLDVRHDGPQNSRVARHAVARVAAAVVEEGLMLGSDQGPALEALGALKRPSQTWACCRSTCSRVARRVVHDDRVDKEVRDSACMLLVPTIRSVSMVDKAAGPTRSPGFQTKGRKMP